MTLPKKDRQLCQKPLGELCLSQRKQTQSEQTASILSGEINWSTCLPPQSQDNLGEENQLIMSRVKSRTHLSLAPIWIMANWHYSTSRFTAHTRPPAQQHCNRLDKLQALPKDSRFKLPHSRSQIWDKDTSSLAHRTTVYFHSTQLSGESANAVPHCHKLCSRDSRI